MGQATALVCLLPSPSLAFVRCRGSSKLKNLWGDALTDPVSCIGPEGQVYPHREVAALAAHESRANSGRRGRSLFSGLPSTLDPSVTQQRLLEAYGNARDGGLLSRTRREDTSGCVVGGAPPRLCKSSECEVLHGECIQTYVPYLFLVIPLGPVTLTGQDYVLVESGCTCRPKYATPGTDPNPQDIIPNFS